MRERISCTSSRSMLTLPEKALLVKLYYQNGECVSAALRPYRHNEGDSKSGRPSTSRNAAETVKDEMETVAGSSMHGEVSAPAVARHTGIPYTTVWLALRRTLRCYPYKIHRHNELLPGDFVNRRAFAVWAFQKMVEDDD
ncbi:DUF4817 domain-containing protein [Trichonephila clavipes]|nr:DUF4817 domain-containing protein [Trichonephila clavipes]